MKSVSLIIPMYNEQVLIADTVKTVEAYFKDKKYDYEILIIDDGSTDLSVRRVTPHLNARVKLISNGGNKGKGMAVKKGILLASKDYVGFMDADMPYSLDGVSKLFEQLEKSDISIGTRALPESRVDAHPLWYRRILGTLFCKFREFIVGTGIKDTQCGAKCFRNNVAKKIFSKQKLNGWGFDVETLFLARKFGYSVSEVPLHLLEKHSFKKSKVNPLIDPIKMFLDLFRIRFYNLIGVY